MLFKQFFLCFSSFLALSVNCQDVTFKNVKVNGYSLYTFKFNYTIKSSNNLQETLPQKKIFDHIEIIDAEIPVLRHNSISNIENLDELTLNNDKIKELEPGCFKNVPQLRKLTIKNNEISTIKEGVFSNLNIATLDLTNNGINQIEAGAFDNMPELLNIILWDNKITKWNKNWFANTPMLSRVSFQNNQITQLPANAFVNLEGNKIFGSLTLKINIIMSHNQISEIDKKAFNGLKEINNLWLDYNQINNWNEDLLSGVQVTDLRLDNNNLNCLNGNFDKIFKANTTYLDSNPWDCGCLKNIKQWKNENNKDIQMFYASLTCDAERIEQKMKNLQNTLKELKKNRTATSEVEDLLE